MEKIFVITVERKNHSLLELPQFVLESDIPAFYEYVKNNYKNYLITEIEYYRIATHNPKDTIIKGWNNKIIYTKPKKNI